MEHPAQLETRRKQRAKGLVYRIALREFIRISIRVVLKLINFALRHGTTDLPAAVKSR